MEEDIKLYGNGWQWVGNGGNGWQWGRGRMTWQWGRGRMT